MTTSAKGTGQTIHNTNRRRFFTIAEANRSLVLIERIAADIIADHSQLLDMHERVEAAQAASRCNSAEATRYQLAASVRKLQGFLTELEAVGVELKDWSLGMVDFPSIICGREVRLCWQHGQEDIQYWHELDMEPADRQPIEDLLGSEAVAASR